MSFYDDASWLLIPSGIEEDIVFAQKPISGLGDLTFTRASDATYTDSTGVVRRSPYNLFQYSEIFTDASWTKLNSATTANVTTAPNGTFTADKLALIAGINPLATDGTGLSQSIAVNSGIYTYSIYLKAAERNIARWRDGGSTGQYLVVNLNDGTFTNGAPARFQNVQVNFAGNGWYRVQFTTGTITNPNVYPLRFGDTGQTGDGTSGGFIWGAQLVEGNQALDYFPTTNRQDVPRIDFRNADGTLSSCGRLLFEPQRTNSIRNSSMVGAVAGTPGTLPTNWSVTNAGLTQTVVGVGTESGLPYIDFRFNGTAIGDSLIVRFDSPTAITASNGQTWSESVYIKKIAEPAPPTSYRLGMLEYTGAGVYIRIALQTITATTTLQRVSFTNTLSGGAGVGAVQAVLQTPLTIGTAYDFTIRIAAPQMELGAYATTWVPTTTAAVTRLADFASKTGVSSLIGQTEGTWFCEIHLSKLIGATARDFFVIGDGRIPASASAVYCSFSGIGSNLLRARVVQSGVVKYDQRHTITATGTYKIALAYKSQDCAMYVNGSFVGTVAQDDAFSFSLNQIFTSFDSSSFQFADGVAQAALFPTRLTNAELEQLTTL